MKDLSKKKLCKASDKKTLKKQWDDYLRLVQDPKFICRKCGRAAAHKKNLCKPEKIQRRESV